VPALSNYDRTVIECFLQTEEGESLRSYLDSGKTLTIGYGHTGADVKPGETIIEAQARALEDHDLEPIFTFLIALVTSAAPSTFENLGLASFAFNCGLGALKSVFAGTAKIEHYIHDHKGNVQPGLVHRRRFELALLGMDITVLDNPK
jgi:lysozyme